MGWSMQKGILVKALVLKLHDFDKKFEIHFDAFDFAIKGVLVQDGRPMSFESKKLSEIKWRCPTHEKEMWGLWYIVSKLEAIT